MSLSPPELLKRSTPPTILTLICLAAMSALVMNMFLPSLPGMAEYFHTEYRIMQLSVAINLAVSGFLQIFIGPLGDKFGRRHMIIGGLCVFLIATLGCLTSTNIWIFLTFRALQAFVATAMVLSRAIVRDLFPQDRAASVMGYVTMGMSVSPMLGPILGGYLDEAYGWHANFWALFIMGLVVMALVVFDLGETAPAKGQKFRDQFQEYPELLRSPRFWGYTLAAAFSSGAFFAYLGGAPFVGTKVFGLTPKELGLHFSTPAIGYFFGNFISGRYSERFGVNKMVLWGAWIVAIGIGLNLVITLMGLGHSYIFFGLMTTMGAGNGLVIPNATAGALSVRPRLAGTASGLGGALMIGGGAAWSAWSGAMLTEGSGAAPLLWIRFLSSVLGIAAILLVMSREQRLRVR